ncbi:MAG: response regulator [Gammaproteobacteria bacterium]|nr:response regulator [Gammaproteobacteria bacterium]MCF6363756.1 response regulator [Gammaproteobacteria bacterium]
MRVLLIDDHTLFRLGLKNLLERSGIDVVGAASTGHEGLDIVHETKPDVVLLDMRMPDMDGLSVLKKLRENGVKVPIAMLTTSSEEHDLVESLRNGAQGYLLKDMEPEDLVAALQRIVDGETVVTPQLAGTLARALSGNSGETEEEKTPLSGLTPRETEIIEHLAEGQSNKVIARELGITDGTVKLHVKAILRKLNISSRVEAAVIAVEQGLGRRRPPPGR